MKPDLRKSTQLYQHSFNPELTDSNFFLGVKYLYSAIVCNVNPPQQPMYCWTFKIRWERQGGELSFGGEVLKFSWPLYIGSNRPGMPGTVPDLLVLSRVLLIFPDAGVVVQ